MSWYIHPSKQLREDELPPELVVTNGNGSVQQVYVPHRTCHNVHEPPRNTEFWPIPHFKCSECGATHVSMDYVFYCPSCGAEVVDA